MAAVARYLQAAFGSEAVENCELLVLWMPADKRLFIKCAWTDMGLMIDQSCVRQVRRELV